LSDSPREPQVGWIAGTNLSTLSHACPATCGYSFSDSLGINVGGWTEDSVSEADVKAKAEAVIEAAVEREVEKDPPECSDYCYCDYEYSYSYEVAYQTVVTSWKEAIDKKFPGKGDRALHMDISYTVDVRGVCKEYS
jgi:hypothetical protein